MSPPTEKLSCNQIDPIHKGCLDCKIDIEEVTKGFWIYCPTCGKKLSVITLSDTSKGVWTSVE